MEEIKKKKVDENWKEATQKEKESQDVKKESEEGFLPEEPDFNFFVSTLGMQASIALGDIPNPMTKNQQTDLKQAKFFIDTLSILKEKTSGNLTLEEDNFLDKLLYELKMRFVEKSKESNIGG